MPKIPRDVAGFAVLPVTLKTTINIGEAKHYIYVKEHEPHIPDEDTAQSLFLVNIPVSTSELHLKHLFASQLGSGRVSKISFSTDGVSNSSSALIAPSTTKSSKKRKRQQTTDELETALDRYCLPSAFPSDVRVSGSTAIVTFVDRQSMRSSLKAVRHASKSTAEPLIWAQGLQDRLAPDFTGLPRYEAHKTLQYPSRAALLSVVDNYMTAYSALESARAAENARKRSAPDEDGFVTVTKGTKGGAVLKEEEAEDLKAKQKAKQKGLDDFYRFQMRERRKEQAGDFMRRFEEDKQRVDEMRRNRSHVRPEG